MKSAAIRGASLAILLLGGLSAASTANEHEHGSAAQSAARPLRSDFEVVEILRTPRDFRGNVTYDADSGRLFLVSFGPPANTEGPSYLYELDPRDGRALRRAMTPFLGELAGPVVIGGFLYQGVAHESKIYKVDIGDDAFGRIVDVIELPSVADIGYRGDEVLRFPFISFNGMARTPEDKLLLHAKDLGELLVVDPETGQVTKRTPTVRGISGITGARGPGGEFLLVANLDPVKAAFEAQTRRFMFRSGLAEPPLVSHGKRAILWLLLDASTGETLASHRRLDPPEHALGTALVAQEPLARAPYGRLTLFALGEDGLMRLQWTPGVRS